MFALRSSLLALLLLPAFSSFAYDKKQENKEDCKTIRQFTFSWQFKDACNLKPRGGTTKGAALELAEKPHLGWLSLQDSGISKYEKDRRAILAMAGPYRTSFDFLEVAGFTPGFEPDAPYQSWGTEYVYVVEERKDFISLQHIMVMFIELDGNISGPIVMKHWRQDWQYEKKKNLVYRGNNHFALESVPHKKVKGSWSQSVFQVDDSPRYESYGYWEHKPNLSTWVSQQTWRPLPRREHSIRDDYQTLEGVNRHTILPTGWIHEQENYKLVLDDKGQPVEETPYLAKELAVNRYDLIQNFDFSAGDVYWKETGAFWAEVRKQWTAMFNREKKFGLKDQVDGKGIFVEFFGYAEKNRGDKYDTEKGAKFVAEVIDRFLIRN